MYLHDMSSAQLRRVDFGFYLDVFVSYAVQLHGYADFELTDYDPMPHIKAEVAV